MKKWILFLLAFALLTGSVAAPATAEVLPTPEDEMDAHLAVDMGDANGDGAVNAADALTLLQTAVGKPTPLSSRLVLLAGAGQCAFTLDCTGDGALNVADALAVLRLAVRPGSLTPILLAPADFSTRAFSAAADSTDYFEPVALRSEKEAAAAAAAKPALAPAAEGFDFSAASLLVFYDSLHSPYAPTACQVAQNGGNLLLRLRYTGEAREATAHIVALALPKAALPAAPKLEVQRLGSIAPTQPNVAYYRYCLEGRFEMTEREQTVARTEEELANFSELLAARGWQDRATCDYLLARSTAGYTAEAVTLLIYNFGLHGYEDVPLGVEAVTKEGEVATITLKRDIGNAPSAALTVDVIAVELPAALVEGCTQFVWKWTPED